MMAFQRICDLWHIPSTARPATVWHPGGVRSYLIWWQKWHYRKAPDNASVCNHHSDSWEEEWECKSERVWTLPDLQNTGDTVLPVPVVRLASRMGTHGWNLTSRNGTGVCSCCHGEGHPKGRVISCYRPWKLLKVERYSLLLLPDLPSARFSLATWIAGEEKNSFIFPSVQVYLRRSFQGIPPAHPPTFFSTFSRGRNKRIQASQNR